MEELETIHEPPPRPCYPLVSFGFGGTMLVMFPKVEAPASTENSFGEEEHPAQAGPVRIMQLSSVLQTDSSVAALTSSFPGPLSLGAYNSRSDVIAFCEQQAATAGLGSSSGILWRLLALRVRHGGAARQASSSAGGENLVCIKSMGVRGGCFVIFYLLFLVKVASNPAGPRCKRLCPHVA